MPTIRLLVTSTLVLGVAACSYPKRARTVRLAELSNPEATRIYNYMRSGDGHDEPRADHLIDEATIESLDGGRACFGLVIRTATAYDLHPSQWSVKVNGVAAEVVERARPETESWSYTERTLETVYERTTPRGTTTVQRPVEYERTAGYAVRRAQACAWLAAPPSKLALEVELPQPNYQSDWGERYEWQLR